MGGTSVEQLLSIFIRRAPDAQARGRGPRGRVLRMVSAFLFAGFILIVPTVRAAQAGAATTAETNAVNWAVGKIGNTSFGTLCLKFVTEAYETGGGINIKSLTNWTAYNATTDPEEVWDAGFKSGTTGNGTPPYGALVFYNATGSYNPETFSHVTIMGSGTEMISTNDVVNESAVHYETMAQVVAKHPYNTYVGWWLPDGASGGGGGSYEVAFQANNGSLYTYSPSGPSKLTLGMMPGTSPSIAAVTGGYEIAFQANTGTLWGRGRGGQ